MNRNTEEVVGKFLEFEKMFPPFIRDLETGLCVPEVAKGWEWCFDPTQCYYSEKLDGTNVKVEVVGTDVKVFVRNQTHKGFSPVGWNSPEARYINQGVINHISSKASRFKDGIYYGEVIGPVYAGNKYKLDKHLWVRFDPFKDNSVAVHKDCPTTDNFEEWKSFILGLQSQFNPEVESEGIIFKNRADGRMAKLRKDMFDIKYAPIRPQKKKKRYEQKEPKNMQSF